MDSWQYDGNEEEDDPNVTDFSFGGKDALIFLIDVSTPSMHIKNEDDDSPLQIALKCVHSTLRRKVNKIMI